MGLLKFYSATIRLLYSVLRLARVRLGLFSRVLVILSTLILITPLAYADVEYGIRNGRLYAASPTIKTNGFQSIRYLDGAKPTFSEIYHADRDLSTLRSVMTGATARTRLPVVASRTVPRAAVVSKVFTNARAVGIGAKAIGGRLLPYVGWGMLAMDIYNAVAESKGFHWSAEHQNWVKTIDGKTYMLVLSNEHDSIPQKSDGWTLGMIQVWCASPPTLTENQLPRHCHYLGTVPAASVNEAITAVCQSMSRVENGQIIQGKGIIAHNVCGNGIYRMPEPNGIYAFPYSENVITFKESDVTDQDLAKNPDKWVEAAGPGLQWSDWKLAILGNQTVMSDPFTDPKDGKAKQAQWYFYNCPDGVCVRETIINRPDLKPNSPEAPAPKNPPAGSTGSGDKPGTETPPPFDLCKEHPDILACDQQPESEDADLTIPKETVNLDFKPENVFSTDAACPKGEEFEAFGGRFSISLEPACAAARKIRPFIIVGAWLVAAFFVARVVRQEV